MIVIIRVCLCGRTHDVASWIGLAAFGRTVHGGKEWRVRVCSCGRPIEVPVTEDDAAQEIVDARREASLEYCRARIELAFLRVARASSFALRWESVLAHREAARQYRGRAMLLEATLASYYEIDEEKHPKHRIGRTLVLVEGDERVPAARRAARR